MNTGRIPERGGLCNEQYVWTVCLDSTLYDVAPMLSYVTTHVTYCGFAHELWFLHTHLLLVI